MVLTLFDPQSAGWDDIQMEHESTDYLALPAYGASQLTGIQSCQCWSMVR